jgi:predicted AAA+ superfamily ATPase
VIDREIRSLLKASAELKCERLLVITNDLERTEKHSWFGFEGEVEFIPLWKWFLISG